MSSFYHEFFFNPIYNLLIVIFKVLPFADAGLAVIIVTFLIRLVLFPLSKKAIVTQVKMQELSPELKDIKKKYKNDREGEAKATLAAYKTAGVNPFSGIFVLFIQLPLIWALYRIFLDLPKIDSSFLYSFIQAPAHISVLFLGMIDVTQKSVILALFAAAASFFQLRLSTARQVAPEGDGFSDNLARSMQTQMKYIFPVLVFFISYRISGVVALYWFTTSLFTYCQELYIRHKLLPKGKKVRAQG